MCSLPLLRVLIPAMSPLPSSPALPCSNRNLRAWVFLPWFPAVLWALVRSYGFIKQAWPVKEKETWITLVRISKLEACKCYSQIHATYCWMSGLSKGSLLDLERIWHMQSIRSPWPDGELKSPCFSISSNSAVTQGWKFPKGRKMLGTQLFLGFDGIWASDI